MVGDERIGQKACSMQSTIAVMYKSLSSVCVCGRGEGIVYGQP